MPTSNGDEMTDDTREELSGSASMRPSDPDWKAAFNAARAAHESADDETATEWAREAVGLARKAIEADDADDAARRRLARSLELAGDIAIELGRSLTALEHYTDALTTLGSIATQPASPADRRRACLVRRSMAEALIRLDRPDDAMRHLQQYRAELLALHEEAPGLDSLVDAVLATVRLGWFLLELDRTWEARELAEDAVHRVGDRFPEDLPEPLESPLADLQIMLARTEGDLDRSAARLDDVVTSCARRYERDPGPTSAARLLSAIRERAAAETARSNAPEAAEILERGLDLVITPSPEPAIHPANLAAGVALLMEAADARDSAGDPDRRKSHLGTAIALLRQAPASDRSHESLDQVFRRLHATARQELEDEISPWLRQAVDQVAVLLEKSWESFPDEADRLRLCGFGHLLRAQVAEHDERIEDATRDYGRYVHCFDTLGTDFDPDRWGHDQCMALGTACGVAIRFGRLETADGLFEDARRVMTTVATRDPSEDHLDTLAGVMREGCRVAEKMGEFDLARRRERMQLLVRRQAVRRHPEVARPWEALVSDLTTAASHADRLGDRGRGDALRTQAVTRAESALTRHPESASIRWELAMSLRALADGTDPSVMPGPRISLLDRYLEQLRWLHERFDNDRSRRDLMIGLMSVARGRSESGDVRIATILIERAEQLGREGDQDVENIALLIDSLATHAEVLLDHCDHDDTTDADRIAAILTEAERLARDLVRRTGRRSDHGRLSRTLSIRSRHEACRGSLDTAMRCKREEIALDLEHLEGEPLDQSLEAGIELAERAGRHEEASLWRAIRRGRTGEG